MVKGTGVNGSGKLSCAAAAVSTATNTTDRIRAAVQTLADACVLI